MSTLLLIPLNDQGAFQDRIIAPILQEATAQPAQFSDLFLFSHGWWTNADAAMVDYDRFATGFTRCILTDPYARPLAVPVLGNYFATGLHWPSVLTEDAASVLNYAQALTFFTMRQRADAVGENGAYAALNVALRSRTVSSFHLIGHSFGCRVVCGAVQKLLTNDPASLDHVDVRMILLEPALDQEDLEPDQAGAPPNRYALVLSNPNVRTLITRSSHDVALSVGYPLANAIGDVVNHAAGGKLPGIARELLAHLGGGLRDVAQAAGTAVGRLVNAWGAVFPQHPVGADELLGPTTNSLQKGEPRELTVARMILHGLLASRAGVALAAGAAGLRDAFIRQLGDRYAAFSVGPNWQGPPAGVAVAPGCVAVADLTDLHAGQPANPPWNDHHSDIYLSEIYRLVAWFLFSRRGRG